MPGITLDDAPAIAHRRQAQSHGSPLAGLFVWLIIFLLFGGFGSHAVALWVWFAFERAGRPQIGGGPFIGGGGFGGGGFGGGGGGAPVAEVLAVLAAAALVVAEPEGTGRGLRPSSIRFCFKGL